MFEISRWEGEGGLNYNLTHREQIIKILKEAGIGFEIDTFGEKGTEEDITVYPSKEERVYFSFEQDGFLKDITVFYS